MFYKSIIVFLLLLSINISSLYANEDPLDSPMWQDVKKMFLKKEAYVFDKKNIIIKVPTFADNPLQVPIYIDASYYKNAKRLLVFADLNAIIPIIDMELKDFKAVISLNIKIAQGTPLRAAVKDENGLWHIASAKIDSFGGGCSVASTASGMEDWQSLLGKHKIKVFEYEKRNRIKLSIFHPMDTGLFVGNPEFYLNEMYIEKNKKQKAKIKMFASISENPRFIFETKKTKEAYVFKLKDSDGNNFVISTRKMK